MSPLLILSIVVGYFLVLLLVSYFTSRNATNESFYVGDRNSKWYLVAFGMIGTSLSGITFISIPGTVEKSQFGYMQVVIGYLIGYLVVAYVLLPLYYRLNVTSIYTYLQQRFDNWAYRTGAIYFLISRVIGASLRLFLVALVLQTFVFDALGVPFELTVALSIFLIWVYTAKGGIKTIVWTDTLQTFFMLLALGLSIHHIMGDLDLSVSSVMPAIRDADMGQWFFTENYLASNYFIKQIIAGAFITICMTGLDQDMMQKNLSCKNLKEAQWNMISFSGVLFAVNIAFLALGGLLYLYTDAHPEIVELMAGESRGADKLFPTIALQGNISPWLGVTFLLGLIAAAYSSADSALTALTTSVCIDLLETDKQEEKQQERTRKIVHVAMSVLIFLVIVVFNRMNEGESLIWELFKAAGYTYGPLLGLFSFGMFTKRMVKGAGILAVCFVAPVLIYLLNELLKLNEEGYQFGLEIIAINGALTFLGLLLISKSENYDRRT